jgi:hypothetical protein
LGDVRITECSRWMLDISCSGHHKNFTASSSGFCFRTRKSGEPCILSDISIAPLFKGNALPLAVEKRLSLILAGYSPGYPNPVRMEYVAQDINWASGHAAMAGRILHLCSGPEEAIKIPVLMEHIHAYMRRSCAHSCHPALPLSEFFTLSLRRLNHP